MDLVILLASIALFLGGVISIIGGGGLGIVLIIVLEPFYGIRTAVVLMSIMGFVIQGFKFSNYYQSTHWPTVWWYSITGIPLAYIGGFLLYILPETAIQLGLGIMCLAFVVTKFFHWIPTFVVTKPRLLFLGALNGIVSGAVGYGGIIRNLGLLSLGFSKEAFLGTASMIALLGGAAKVIAYMQEFSFTESTTKAFVACAIAIVLGMYTGKKLLKYTSNDVFEKLLLTVIFIGGIRLFFS